MSRARLAVALTVAVAAAVAVRAYGFFSAPFLFFAKVAWLGASLALLVAGLAGWGALLFRVTGLPGVQPLARAWALGAILTATLWGAASWAWFPPPWAGATWLLCGVLVGWPHRHRLVPDRLESRLGRLTLWFLPFSLAALALALAPPLSLDSLVYHLAIPRQFALAGRAFEMPWSAHSYFPHHAEMLFGLALGLGGGVLAQLLHLLAAVLAVLTTRRLGRRLFPGAAGDWAALLLATVPVLALVAGWAWSDWLVLLYLALAFEARDELVTAPHGRGLLLVTLLAAGAASVKTYALPLLLLPCLPPFRRRGSRPGLAAVSALLLLAPWYGRNLVQRGNPVYPLGSGETSAAWLAGYRGAEPFWERIAGYLGRPDLADESLGVLLLCLVPLLLVLPEKGDRRLLPCWLVLGLYLPVAVLAGPTVRAFSPFLLALAVLAGGALVSVETGSAWRRAGLVALHAALAVNFVQVLWVVQRYEPLSVALGFESPQRYLATGQSYYPAFQWIEARSSATEGVLVVGESRIFHLERLAVAGSYLDPHPLSAFLEGPSCDAACAAEGLRRAGIAWVYLDESQYRVTPPEERRFVDERTFQATPDEDRVFRELLGSFAREVFRDGPRAVHRLEGGASRPAC